MSEKAKLPADKASWIPVEVDREGRIVRVVTEEPPMSEKAKRYRVVEISNDDGYELFLYNEEVILATDAERLEREVEQLRVQLAGIGVAASGGTSPAVRVNEGDYGWSVPYEAVLKLYARAESAERKVHELNAECDEWRKTGARLIQRAESAERLLARIEERVTAGLASINNYELLSEIRAHLAQRGEKG